MVHKTGHSLREDAIHALKDAKIDVFLLIDYRRSYDNVLNAILEHMSAPIILWARDPRTEQQIQNLEGKLEFRIVSINSSHFFLLF